MRTSSRALLAVAALLAAMLVTGPPRAARAADVPGTSCSVFPANNVWNTDISNLPVNTNSAAWLNSTGAGSGRLLHPDFGGPPYGIPFNVASNTTATHSFSFLYASESDPGPYPIPPSPLIEQGSDAHMLVINKDTCTLYETAGTDLNTYSGWAGAIFDLASNHLRTAGYTSADAAGLPIFPGLVRLDEVQAGFIGHAIRFTVQRSDQSYLWPARHEAGAASDPTLPPMGARFRLKQSYDISSFGAAAQVVLTAFKHYGLIVADNGSNWYFQGTEDSGWNSPPYDTMIAQLKTVPASAFEAVDESVLMVNPDSAQVASVPSAASAPTASPRDASATVTWAAPPDGGAPITGYVITGSPAGHAIAGAAANSAVVFGLTNGVSYTFTVKATNVIGTGAASPPSNAVTPNSRLTATSPGASASGRGGVQQSGAPHASPSPPRLPRYSPPDPTPAQPSTAPAAVWAAAEARLAFLRV